MIDEQIPLSSSETLEYMAQIAKDAPLHVQIRENLRRQILAGVYKPGDRIPSEEDLGESWHVNRLTARRSVSDLVNEGLLQRRPGVGTFVIGRKFLRDQSALISFWEATRAMGMQPSAKLIGQETTQASVDIAVSLEVPEGEPIYRVRRLRLADGEILAYHIAHIPAKFFAGLLEIDLASQSLYALYRSFGYPPASGEQRIEAIAANEEVATLLGVPAGSPVLFLQRTTRTAAGMPIEVVWAYLRSDRYVIYIPLHTSGKIVIEYPQGEKTSITEAGLLPDGKRIMSLSEKGPEVPEG